MTLFLFLVQVFIISFSGAMSPGPITATAITMGARNRWAGSLLAVGHGIVEFPLMILIILGLGEIFQNNFVKIFIGFAGGTILLLMAAQMFKAAATNTPARIKTIKDNPVLAGIILTSGNPFFLVWWATTGLLLASKARPLGIWAFALFTIVHWLVDLIWVTSLSLASFHGTTLLGHRSQTIILKICAAAMLFFGLFFLYQSIRLLM